MRAFLCGAWGAILLMESVQAATLFPAFQGDVARTLPRGRWMVSYARAAMSVQDQFGANGVSQPISDEVSQRISWREVEEAQPIRSEQLGGLLDAYGVDPGSDAGELVASIDARVDLQVPVIGYGVSDRFGVFLAIPIQRVRVESKVAYRKSDAAEKFARDLENQGQTGAAQELSESLADGFKDGVERAGYRSGDSLDRSGLGDLRLELPYLFDGKRRRGLIGTIILPTGEPLDPSDLYPVSHGTGRVQLGVRGVMTSEISSRWEASLSGGPLVPLPARLSRRVPRRSEDRLSSEIDPEARVSGGLSYQVQAHGKVRLSSLFSGALGVQHQNRFSESWSGSAVAPERYRFLEERTAERLESAFVNLEMNTVSEFLKQRFPIPFQFNAAVAFPLMGKNTVDETLGVAQTTFFF